MPTVGTALRAFSGTETLVEVLAAAAATAGDDVAMTFETRVTRYDAFVRGAELVAMALTRDGVRRGDRILYLGKNSDRFFILWFGAMRIGAVIVPLNWRLAPREIGAVAADAGAMALFLGPQPHSDACKAALAAVNKGLCVDLCGEGADGGVLSYDAWLQAPCPADGAPLSTVMADDIAIQLYTSGTTGLPKGVLLSHRALIVPLQQRLAAGIEWEGLQRGDTAIVDLPIYHLGGATWPVIALAGGASLLIKAEFSAQAIVQAYASHRVPALLMVPATMQLLLEAAGSERADFSSLRVIRYGGSPISEDLLRQCVERFRCDFVQTYGSTETGGIVTALGPKEHLLPATPRMRSAGRALPGVELAIAAPDGALLPPGSDGELLVRSKSNMSGYWRRPDATVQAWIGDGWLRTGDAARIDADGYLYVLDRMRDMIITGGENVYPAEVENALSFHPDVAEVAVVGQPDPRWGEAAVAFVVQASGSPPLDPSTLMGFCREYIAAYKCPKQVVLIDQLPRNSSGKVLRNRLRERLRADSAQVSADL